MHLLARVALTCAYWWGGLSKLGNMEGTIAEVSHFVGADLAVVTAWLTIVLELVASLLLIIGRATWLAAGALAVFTALATYLAHDFWNMVDPVERFRNLNAFLEHIGLIGGLLIAAALAQVKGKKGD